MLLQVILNKDVSYQPDPILLEEPSHVMLNHLYAQVNSSQLSSILSKYLQAIRDDLLVLSSTQRFRKKYVTTLLYKPIWYFYSRESCKNFYWNIKASRLSKTDSKDMVWTRTTVNLFWLSPKCLSAFLYFFVAASSLWVCQLKQPIRDQYSWQVTNQNTPISPSTSCFNFLDKPTLDISSRNCFLSTTSSSTENIENDNILKISDDPLTFRESILVIFLWFLHLLQYWGGAGWGGSLLSVGHPVHQVLLILLSDACNKWTQS